MNYVKLEQFTNHNEKIVGKWVVPDDQTEGNYICQSPKVSQSVISTTTTPWWDTTTTTPWWDTTTTTPWWDTTTTPSDDDLVCMEGFEDIVTNTGKCYYISSADNLMTWDDAQEACTGMINWDYDVEYTSQNTQLVVLNSDDENDQLFDTLYDMDIDSVWIGLSWTGK